MNYCPNCGSALKEDPAYCPSCGQKLVSRSYEADKDKDQHKSIKSEVNEARTNAIGAGFAGGLLIGGGLAFVLQRVVSVDIFDIRVVMIDKGAIGGVIAIILGIVCCIAAEQYGSKYKELKKRL